MGSHDAGHRRVAGTDRRATQVAVAEAEQKLREQMLAMEEKTRIRVADELVEAQRFWQEAADLKLAAERAQWQADAERRVAEAESKAKFDPDAQAKLVAEVEARLKAEHAQEMDGMRASIDAMMAANAQRLEKEHSQRIAVMESQWRNSTAHTANEARAAASTEVEQRIAELTRERDEAIARLAQQPAAVDSAMSADRVTLEIRIAQLETERDAAVRRAEDSQRNLALREEAQSELTSQSNSQLAAAVAAERMKWQSEAEQRVAAERREKEQAVELLKLAEARLRAMPTVDPALEAKWKADMEMQVAQTRAALTGRSYGRHAGRRNEMEERNRPALRHRRGDVQGDLRRAALRRRSQVACRREPALCRGARGLDGRCAHQGSRRRRRQRPGQQHRSRAQCQIRAQGRRYRVALPGAARGRDRRGAPPSGNPARSIA